jgi:hypothetical protein
MSTSWEPLPSIYRSKQEFLASLPPWRRLLQKLNWHPTIDTSVRQFAIEQRLLQMRSENARLSDLNAKFSAISSSSLANLSLAKATPNESEI